MLVKDTSETTEFTTPDRGLDVSAYIPDAKRRDIHHVARYQWAALALRGLAPKRVIDIACGAGYGSMMIADAFPDSEVIGVDYDARAIEHAQASYGADNLTYRTGDITSWTSGEKPLGSFDAIVSFDTLEHLLHREIALIRIAEALTDAGWLLFSTPCGRGQNQLNPGWEHHKIEYSHSDLFSLLCRFFGEVVQPQDPDFPAADFWPEKVNKDEVIYLNRMNPVVCKKPIRTPAYKRRV